MYRPSSHLLLFIIIVVFVVLFSLINVISCSFAFLFLHHSLLCLILFITKCSFPFFTFLFFYQTFSIFLSLFFRLLSISTEVFLSTFYHLLLPEFIYHLSLISCKYLYLIVFRFNVLFLLLFHRWTNGRQVTTEQTRTDTTSALDDF